MRKFKITNPYAGVDWDSWHHYKTNLHTHSTASDAQVDFSVSVDEKPGFFSCTYYSTSAYSA